MKAKLCKEVFSQQFSTCKATGNSCFQTSTEMPQETEYTDTKDNPKKMFLGVGPPEELWGDVYK